MLDKIKRVIRDELEWGLDGIISPDRIEITDNIATAVVQAIRDNRDYIKDAIRGTEHNDSGHHYIDPGDAADAAIGLIGGD